MFLVQLSVTLLVAGLGIQPMDDADAPSADAPSETAGEVCTADCLPEAPASTSSSCGDGTADLDEECDDGNTDPSDGCSSECEIEDGHEPFASAPALSTTR